MVYVWLISTRRYRVSAIVSIFYPLYDLSPDKRLSRMNRCELDLSLFSLYFCSRVKYDSNHIVLGHMKQCKDLKLVPYRAIIQWVKSKEQSQSNPVLIQKYGSKSILPFRMWSFAGCLLLMSNEKAKVQAQYILNKKKWLSFFSFVKENPEMSIGDLARCYSEFECTNKVFWPSIISICKAYLEEKNLA